MYAVPQLIQTEIYVELPAALRRSTVPAGHAAAGGGALPAGCFLEGPAFDRAGNLYVVDIPYGRIFRISPQQNIEVVAEYDGEPNGLCIHRDGRIFVADHVHGIMLLDPGSGTIGPYIERYHREGFRGVNDLVFASNGDLYFTDQGQSDLLHPNGRVYRYTPDGVLQCIADHLPSPNGLVLNLAENALYVAVTRANAIWHLPLLPDGTVGRTGVHIQLSGGRGPDGIALNGEGGLAVAHQNIGAVWLFTESGEPLYRIQSMCARPHVTNVAYGGTDNRDLFITDSGNGCVLKARVPIPGRVLYSHL